MDVEIDQRRGDVFHRRTALVEGPRGDEAAQQIRRNRLAGAKVDGEAAEDFRPLKPMLVELRGQFHPVREHAGARDHRIGDVGEERVQCMAEFVKQRPGIVERKQRRLALAALGKIHDIDDQRPDVAPELFLIAQRRHPGAAVLRAAREIVAEEKPAMPPGGIAHLPYPHVVMPDRDPVAAFEGQSEQAVRGVEGSLDDAVELEVRLDRRLVDVATQLAQLLRVIPPVPRGEREILSFILDQALERHAIFHGAAARRQPHPLEQANARPPGSSPWRRRAGNGQTSDSRAAARARRAAPPSRQ